MLRWFSRLRRPVNEVARIAARPVHVLHSREPAVAAGLWRSPSCCTMVYFWTALVTERVCGARLSESDKRTVLQRAFARLVKETAGDAAAARARVLPEGHARRRRALTDLKRVASLYTGAVSEALMLYPDYREAVEGGGRPALPGNRFGLRTEAAHEILLARYLAVELQSRAGITSATIS